MISFTVAGEPATKGSYRAYTIRRANGKIGARVDNDNPRCKAWQAAVGWKAKIAMGPTLVGFAGPVRVTAEFRFARPKTTKLPAPRQDVDKLLRALFDAMSGVVYGDDRQVVSVTATKAWGDPGVSVTVRAADEINNPPGVPAAEG